MYFIVVIVVLYLVLEAKAWNINSIGRYNPLKSIAIGNANKARMIASVACLSIIFNSFPAVSYAAVGEGGLPDGAMAFSKILKYQKDWDNLANTVKERSSEMSDREVLGMKAFLKQLANEYRDMELLSKGIVDPQKKDKSMEIAKDFRRVIRQCDDAASENDFKKITDLYPNSAQLLNDFLSMLQDVPDEL